MLTDTLVTARNGSCVHVNEIIKRNGQRERFNPEKIVAAVMCCFESSQEFAGENGKDIAADVARAVTNIMSQRFPGQTPTVEDVQRLVIQQLWALSYFKAAEHYTLYREERRKQREHTQITPEAQQAIAADAAHFPTPLQYYQFIDKYARWSESACRRETWRETCDRVFTFLRSQPQLHAIQSELWAQLNQALFQLEALPAMRLIQMAGPALERCPSGAFNCSYVVIDCLEAFDEALYILMQGCGVGFSVESDYINKLPKIRRQRKNQTIRRHHVDDSTEGWCEAYRYGLNTWWNGYDVDYDTSSVRPAGAILKTKGGRASGPEPLRQLLHFARETVLSCQGGYLTPVKAHGLMCMTGKIVQVGGVRRASLLSLSDLDDLEMRHAKAGNWWEAAPWLNMSNNSAVYDEKPDAVEFMEEWLALAKSGSGERGIFNRQGILQQLPKRRKKTRMGVNPCAEIVLRSAQFCNLSIAVARESDTIATLRAKVKLAAAFGTIQATLTDFKYLRNIWRQNCEEERLLGVDITGQMDCPLLRPDNPDRPKLLQQLRADVTEANIALAALLGINPATASTCVKPSGNSAQFLNCSSGVHTRHAPYYIRRVRGAKDNPVSRLLYDEGVPTHVDPLDPNLLVFDFPIRAPDRALTRKDLTAIQQLENWLCWKQNWAEHSVSCTVYVKPEEWLEVGHWVYTHFNDISGIAFLPADGGTYKLAPYEEIDAATYEKMAAGFPGINWAKLCRYEHEDMTTTAQEPACVGGLCEL